MNLFKFIFLALFVYLLVMLFVYDWRLIVGLVSIGLFIVLLWFLVGFYNYIVNRQP